MRLSHTKLTTILQCPMTYYLNYKLGIKPRVKPAALSLGSAVHWGIEHGTDDLTEYYAEGSTKQSTEYTTEQMLAEAMVHGYLSQKSAIFEQLLSYKGQPLVLEDESHEVPFEAVLPTNLPDHDNHIFEGIVDLLLLTDQGFIIIDYKTSSQIPDWDKYLDQIYRYIFLVKSIFPEVPIVKIGIINLRKSQIRQKKTENDVEFRRRLKMEYEVNDGEYIEYHEYLPETLNSSLISAYIDNLSRMADCAQLIEDSKMWYVNFGNAIGVYGKSPYYDIFYQTDGAEVLYKIRDHVWNSESNTFDGERNCVAVDMVLNNEKVLNKYEKFKEIFEKSDYSIDQRKIFICAVKNVYVTDENLLNLYWDTMLKEKEVKT